ncbi:MAG: OmpP1/FadL family transporter [Zoogloeaceae bacterium]|jgi:long-chain fatty acid transport protein|nr:OmpP1/FadL family transporter [Zoogloeaceae bacterium]
MNKMPALLSALALIPAGTALASGFQSLEQNASGLGVAYAGSAAVADNASTIYYNPAGMTLLPARQVSLGIAGVRHRYEFNNHGSFGSTGGDGGDAGAWRAQPNAYLSWAVAPDWVVGVGISSPYGLHTDYDEDWRGRSFGVETRLRTLNVNPSVAYRVSDKVSLGFGLNYQKLKLETDWVNDAGQKLHSADDDSAWGWNAGALLTLSPAMRVGVTYRSALQYDLNDTPRFQGVDADGDLKTPGTFTLSVWQQVSERWEAMGDLSYTRWKTVDDYEHDGWRVAWGAAYTYNSQWKSKFGLAYEHGPLRHQRTAMLPDHHRLWLTLGGQYRLGKSAALDFGYAYQWVKDPDIDQRNGGVRLKGDYDASGHVIGVQYTQDF